MWKVRFEMKAQVIRLRPPYAEDHGFPVARYLQGCDALVEEAFDEFLGDVDRLGYLSRWPDGYESISAPVYQLTDAVLICDVAHSVAHISVLLGPVRAATIA